MDLAASDGTSSFSSCSGGWKSKIRSAGPKPHPPSWATETPSLPSAPPTLHPAASVWPSGHSSSASGPSSPPTSLLRTRQGCLGPTWMIQGRLHSVTCTNSAKSGGSCRFQEPAHLRGCIYLARSNRFSEDQGGMDSAGAGALAAERQAGGVLELPSRGRDLGVVVTQGERGEWKWTNINFHGFPVFSCSKATSCRPHLFPKASEED